MYIFICLHTNIYVYILYSYDAEYTNTYCHVPLDMYIKRPHIAHGYRVDLELQLQLYLQISRVVRKQKAPSPFTTPPLQSWVHDCMAEGPCLTTGARRTDLPNKLQSALGALLREPKKARKRRQPPTPNAAA